ncbi:MAG: phytanoyl-CoA dioxygenase family protein [Pseudomonadota bacterium]
MSDQAYFSEADCDIDAFRALVGRTLDTGNVPLAATIEKGIPVYDGAATAALLEDPPRRRSALAEWGCVLGKGPGVLAISGAYRDTKVLDEATAIYLAIIAQEKEQGAAQADHFATAGANDRVWNALQKLCDRAPDVFARYLGNPILAAVSEAWLGPGYQMTAQINLVRPGGKAQEAHRDYHLGFQTAEAAAQYPAHVHDLSPVMTLQGAIAHCDMPVESGPTKLLPYSQLYRPGYLAYRLEPFRAFFETAYVQLPLKKGDLLFFNPALFHAAGDNVSTDIQRLANLVQVSSPLGRAMESIDRLGMCRQLYPVLRAAQAERTLSAAEIAAAIASAAEGYSFPTNLERDPPIGGLAPETQAALMHRALETDMDEGEFAQALAAQADRRRA